MLSSQEIISKVGISFGPCTVSISQADVEEFAKAVGADLSLGIPATFLTRLRDGEFKLLDRAGIKLQTVLHAEQEYEFKRPLKIGMQLSYGGSLAKAFEKAHLVFLIFETHYFEGESQDPSQLVVTSRTTMVLRRTSG